MSVQTMKESCATAGAGSRFEESDCGITSLCSLTAGSEMFGIDTKKIREVLEEYALRRIPLAPNYIAGVIPYRGDALTTVDLRVLLRLEARSCNAVILVIDEDGANERYGLMVDLAGRVMSVGSSALEANPSTLNACARALFDGVYRLPTGLMVRLDTAKLHPARLREAMIFRMHRGRDEGWKTMEEARCAS